MPLVTQLHGEWSIELEEVEDLCHRHGVSIEYLRQCKHREQDVLTTMAAIGRQPVPPNVRTTALQFMMQVVLALRKSRKSEQDWFEAVSFLDAYFQQADVDIEMVPATCICMMRLVSKLDDGEFNSKGEWLRLAHDLRNHLVRAGVPTPEITQKMLDSHERTILGAMDWRMRGMNVHSWFVIFSKRLSLLSRGRYQRHAISIENLLPRLAFLLVRCEAASPEFSDFDKACGLFCLGLVVTDLLPVDSISSPASSISQAEAVFWQTMLQAGNPQRDVHTEEQCNSMLRMLEVATCSERRALQQAAQGVVGRLALIHAMQPALIHAVH